MRSTRHRSITIIHKPVSRIRKEPLTVAGITRADSATVRPNRVFHPTPVMVGDDIGMVFPTEHRDQLRIGDPGTADL